MPGAGQSVATVLQQQGLGCLLFPVVRHPGSNELGRLISQCQFMLISRRSGETDCSATWLAPGCAGPGWGGTCVCVGARVCVCARTCVHIWGRAQIRLCVCACAQPPPCTHAPVHLCTHAPTDTCTHAPTNVNIHMCMQPCTHAPRHTCTRGSGKPSSHQRHSSGCCRSGGPEQIKLVTRDGAATSPVQDRVSRSHEQRGTSDAKLPASDSWSSLNFCCRTSKG